MKQFFILLAAALLGFSSCSDDNGGKGPQVSKKAQEAFAKKYPQASDVKWSTKSGYLIAKFSAPATKADVVDYSAWFDDGGKWYMTEQDMNPANLPAAVVTALKNTRFADWKIDDVDFLLREGMTPIYVVEVEGIEDGVEVEYDLYFSEDGQLVREVKDGPDDEDYMEFIPAGDVEAIKTLVLQMYPGAKVVEIDKEKEYIEVEIYHEGVEKDVFLTFKNEWAFTKFDVPYSSLEDAVKSMLQANYSDYEVDDVEKVESATDFYYEIELEHKTTDKEIKIKVNSKGEVL